MATVSFYLSRPNRKNDYPIFLTYQSKGKKFRYFTKFKITKDDWNSKAQKIKPSSPLADINLVLNNLKNLIGKIETESVLNGHNHDFDYIRKRFLESTKTGNLTIPEIKSEENEFYNYYNEYIENSKTRKNSKTITQILITLNKLKSFESEYNYKLTFESINLDFYQKFLKYLVQDKKLLNNTVGNNITSLKAFMNYATSMEYNTNLNYKKFKVLREDIEIVYLTEKELFKLYNLEITDKKLKIARDLFCFACFTGLRYSDIAKLTIDQVKEDHLLIRTKKTKDILTIPLVNYSKKILDKYRENGNLILPKIISNREINVNIKELCKLAGIDELTKMVSFSGSNKIEKTVPKYELISFHTSRRTFITLALEKGMRAEVIMQISGHKNYETFKKYIKITDKVKKDELNRIWN